MSQSVCGHKPPCDDCDFCSEADTETELPKLETTTFEAPALWASAFINGDLSGLDYYGPDCVAEFEAWVRANPGRNVVDCSAEAHIGRWNGLQTELLTYTELIERPAVKPSDMPTCDGSCEPMCAWCHRQADIAAQHRT